MKPIHPFGLVLALGWSLAVAPAVAQTGDEAPRMKDLRIVVTDAATGAAISGAEVSAYGREPTKLTTGPAGGVVLPVLANPPSPERDSRFSFQVKAAGCEMRLVEWWSDAGRVRDMLPADYTVALRRGGVAGGIIRDERGKPVSGAKVIVYASELRPRSMGRGEKLQQDYGVVSTGDEDAIFTDEAGRWRKENFPTDITQLSIDVIRPEGGRTRFISGSMYRGPNERGGVVEPSELLRQSAVFEIKEGVTVRGIVVDEAGRPISGVQLRARDASSRNQPHTFFNQADGSFALLHWDVSSVLVTAEKEGYQARSMTIAAGGDAGVGKIVLTPAKPLRIRLLDQNDRPIAGAELQTDTHPRPEQIVSWKAQTDAEGRAEWTTAPDQPVILWINPPKGSPHPFRSARLTADGSEQVIRVRPGSDKAIRVRIRVVDADTGAPVPKFEVWRRLANQPNRPWGDPVEKGEFSGELLATEMPNGWVPSYRLQVRAAGYTGWASEALDFSYGDQEFTLKMAKGESTIAADAPPTPRAGGGLDGERDPQLMALAGSVARLLETADVGAFVQSIQASLDDWKRLLPSGAPESDLPLGSDPQRIIDYRKQAIEGSAQHVLDVAKRVGLSPGKFRFTVKSVSSPNNSSTSFRIGGREISVPFAVALRVVLVGEPLGDDGGKPLRGDYELSVGSVRRFPSGWRTDDGVRWVALPERLADETTRRELALVNRVARTTFGSQPALSAMDDPALLTLAGHITELVRRGDPKAFVTAARLSRDETADFYVRTQRPVTPELDVAYARNTAALETTARGIVASLDRMGIDLRDATLTVKQVLAERPGFMRFGQPDGIGVTSLKITFTAATSRLSKSGQPLAGNYAVVVGNALRVGDRWVLVDDKIRFQEYPPGVLPSDEQKQIELENYIAQHRTLPPGHQAPDVPFIRIEDNAKTSLAAYRGKVVILEFWAVWCGPCQEPMAKLQTLRDAKPEWKDRVEIITVSIDAKAETARAHLAKNGWTKTHNTWAGEGEWKAAAPDAFRVGGVPASYVLDAEGRIVKAGHPASMNFAALVDDELKKSAR